MKHDRSEEHPHVHPHGRGEHGHTHGAVDPTIATSERGIWAIKWSFLGLMVTALLQLAGVIIVLIILFSAVVAGYQAIERIINPQPIGMLWAVAVASVLGFIGNEAVAVFRIKVGREIGSAALVADGYHARTDGWTSLAVLLGAMAVWLGYPRAEPIVGLLIAATSLVMVWQAG